MLKEFILKGTVPDFGFESLTGSIRVRDRYRYRDRKNMALGHEKLDVYRLSIEYVAWVYGVRDNLNGMHRHARNQWLRASQSVPLNIAKGNGKTAEADRRRYFEIACVSVLECAAI